MKQHRASEKCQETLNRYRRPASGGALQITLAVRHRGRETYPCRLPSGFPPIQKSYVAPGLAVEALPQNSFVGKYFRNGNVCSFVGTKGCVDVGRNRNLQSGSPNGLFASVRYCADWLFRHPLFFLGGVSC